MTCGATQDVVVVQDIEWYVRRYKLLTRAPLTGTLTIQFSIVQDGSGSSSKFMAKILGTATALFLCHTQFYFLLLQITAISFSVRFQPQVGSAVKFNECTEIMMCYKG